MQNYTTIMGVIRMREAHSSYDECQRRYQVGSSTCQLIMKRFKSIGLSFQDLQKMDEQKVVDAFYPPDQARRKKTPLPDYEKIYEALTAKGSKANHFYLSQTADFWGDVGGTHWNRSGGKLVPQRRQFGTWEI